MDTIGEASSTPAIRRIELPRWLQPGALAAALLALFVLTISPAPEHARSVMSGAAATRLEALPLAARPLVSRTLGRDQASYRIQRTASGLTATNGPHGLSARFGAQDVQVRAGSDTLALRLRAAGYGASLRPVPAASPAAHANRVSYRRGSLIEWYANGPLGLEQGFTLKAPPTGASSGSLTLALSLSGNLRPTLEPGGRALSFAGSSLRYAGLTAFDARGRSLPASLGLRGQTLLILVDDAGARYPLTIDPFLQLAKLTASRGAASDELGTSVAISGDTVVAGARRADVSGHDAQGALYVFVKPAGGWANATQTAKLTTSDGAAGDQFGVSAAISGDTVVAGALTSSRAGHESQGAAYVFVEPADGWKSNTETAKFTASNGAPGYYFGYSVGISGDTVIVGSQGTDVAGQDFQGTAYVFVKPAGGWASGTQTAKLTAADGAADAMLGYSVAIDGDTIVAGAPGTNQTVGAAYVFVKPAGGWVNGTQTAKLTASNGTPGGFGGGVGGSVAISGDTIVAGAPGNYQKVGEAYVFVEPSGGWANATETAKLTASDSAEGDSFAGALAIAGDTIIAGDPGAELAGKANVGAAYVFVKPPGGWVTTTTPTSKLTPSDGAQYILFGLSAGIAGDTIVAGAPGACCILDPGSVYVFRPRPVVAVTKQLAPASDPGRFDLKVAGTVVKAGAGDGGSGSKEVLPGTYRVTETAVAGTTLSDYATSIACTLNGNPGPSAAGTQLNVTVAAADKAACTITNTRRAQITLSKHLVPSSDPGRFDLKVGATVVKASAGDGDSGSTHLVAGTYTLSEVAASGTNTAKYASSIACTRNGLSGPSGNGASLKVNVAWGDVLACTITNQPGATITLTKGLRPSSDPGRFDLKVAGTVVKAAAGNGGSGSLGVLAGTYRVSESAASGASLDDYATSIACTLNGGAGPSASGTPQLDVMVATGDLLACTFANKRKAQVTP